MIAAGVSFLTDGEETGTGFGVDISQGLASFTQMSVRGVGDFGWQQFDGFTSMSLMAGVRVAGYNRFAPFGQFLVGMIRFRTSFCDDGDCSERNLVLAPGAGIDIALTARIFFRAQVDFFLVRYPDETAHATRLTFGVSMPIGH
jgi:hypothetical protein